MKKTSILSKLPTALLQINNTVLNRCVLLFSYVLILNYSYAQQARKAPVWNITNPFYSPVFIENKGQFNAPDGQQEGNVKYGINNGELKVYFTPSGLSYHITNVQLNAKYKNEKHEIFEKIEESVKENGKVDGNLKKYFDDKSAYINIQWEGANPNAQIVVSDKVNDVYSFLEKDLKGNSIVAPAFKKLTYKNIYPNIDIEYYFSGKNLNDIKSKLGVKYNIIVHPGGDLAKVKMKYSGMQSIKIDGNGNIIAEIPDGNMTDHSPDFSYVGSESKQVQAKFILQGQVVSFSVPSYDKTKQLVIDPFTSIWSVSPGFTTANDGYTIRVDYNQNVYVMGGGVSQGGTIPSYKYQVKKFNSTGVLQWTATDLNSTNLGAYGDMIVLRSGKVIAGMGIGAGPRAYFLDPTTGAITSKNCPGGVNEFGWRLCYNLALNDGVLWAGGGSNAGAHLIKTDTNLNASTRYNPWNSSGGSVNTEDISYLAVDPTSSFVYVTNASNSNNNGVSGSTTAPNFCKVAFATPATALWNVREPTLMMEIGQAPFINAGATPFASGWATGVNGMVVCGNAVYTFDGKNLRSYDPATGTITHTVATAGGIVDRFSGIAVDKCCRVYVGGSGNVYRYKDDLTLDTIIAVTGDVYDLQLDPLNDQHLFVTGKGFVQMLEGKDSYCTACITNTFVNATLCTKGSATVTVNDPTMTLPLSYSWNTNPVQTGSVVTGLDSGMYVVTVTDSRSPCPRTWKDTVYITGKNSVPPIVVNSATICPGGVAILTASGADTYTWTPAASVSPSTGSIVAASPGVTTTYTVSGTFKGCNNFATSVVTVAQGALASFIANPLTGVPPLLVNFTNNSTNASTYLWNFGNGLTSTLPNPSTTYTNTGSFPCTLIAYSSSSICHDTISVDIILEDPFSILIPNVFSPNNDNINDVFHITSLGFSEMNVIIYNRWGKLLYKYDGLNTSWDGTVSGKLVPDGVYYYILEGQTKKNEKYNKSGFITLIR